MVKILERKQKKNWGVIQWWTGGELGLEPSQIGDSITVNDSTKNST